MDADTIWAAGQVAAREQRGWGILHPRSAPPAQASSFFSTPSSLQPLHLVCRPQLGRAAAAGISCAARLGHQLAQPVPVEVRRSTSPTSNHVLPHPVHDAQRWPRALRGGGGGWARWLGSDKTPRAGPLPRHACPPCVYHVRFPFITSTVLDTRFSHTPKLPPNT